MENLKENELIIENAALITKLAKSFKPKDKNQLEEYIQLGRIGLMKAIRKHNPDKGKLSTIAWNSIRWEILKFLSKENKNNTSSIDNVQVEEVQKPEIDINERYPFLEEKEKRVLKQRLEGYNFKEIGLSNGWSAKWAHQIFNKLVKKIQNYEKEKDIVCGRN